MPEIWLLYDKGKTGTRIQCQGVARILGVNPREIALSPRALWKPLPPSLWILPLRGVRPVLEPPWPKVIIAAGRSTVAPCVALKHRLQDKIKIIQVMDPRVDPGLFDLVIAPSHDQLVGPNVLQTTGTLHTLTAESLQAGAEQLLPSLAYLPRPYIAVLLGGKTRRHCLDAAALIQMVDRLKKVISSRGGSLLITPSRRTSPELLCLLPNLLADAPHFISSDNYQGFLGTADQIVVTSDSVSMLSEACFTGKPVYIYPLKGNPGKFSIFYQALVNNGHAKMFTDVFRCFQPARLDERARLGPEIKIKLEGGLL